MGASLLEKMALKSGLYPPITVPAIVYQLLPLSAPPCLYVSFTNVLFEKFRQYNGQFAGIIPS